MTLDQLQTTIAALVAANPAVRRYTVVLAKDAESNTFSPLADRDGVGLYAYEPDTTWSGSIDGNEENAVVLWPIS